MLIILHCHSRVKREEKKMKIRLGTRTILMTVKGHLCVEDKGGF